MKKVSPGDRIAGNVTADAWNDMLDAAREFRDRKFFQHNNVDLYDQRPSVAQALNDTGLNLGRGAVIGACDIWNRPEEDLDEFKNEFIFCGRIPTSQDLGRFLITKDPIIDGQVGEVTVAGVAAVRVYFRNENEQYAEAVPGTADYLVATYNGSAKVVWKPPGTGLLWCYVRIGDPPRSSDATTTTLGPIAALCGGNAKWTWSDATKTWSLEENNCTSASTTTTPAPGGNSGAFTFGAHTFAGFTFGANTFAGEWVTTTTTPAPVGGSRCCRVTTTTTTINPALCYPLYPVFCGAVDGDCTVTSCAQYRNEPPECGQTTTTPTPCDCATTTTASPGSCLGGCSWYAMPIGLTGTYRWEQVSGSCAPGCECQMPSAGELSPCASMFTPCQTTTTARPPSCSGTATFYCDGSQRWSIIASDCSPGCRAAFPTLNCEECGTVVIVPCVSDSTTTTAGPCAYCYTTTTTSTTTTAPPCGAGPRCLFRWNTSLVTWDFVESNCGEECECLTPGYNGTDSCEIARTPCSQTTTTTAAPTTTTTTTSTTTTPPPGAACYYENGTGASCDPPFFNTLCIPWASWLTDMAPFPELYTLCSTHVDLTACNASGCNSGTTTTTSAP